MSLDGLLTINVELTNRCNKSCWMCGRRKVEKEFPELILKYGDMNFELVKAIAKQLPKNIIVQFHKDGEGLLYPRFGEAVSLFRNQIKCITTNGKLLVEKAKEIIGNLDTITISIIPNDPEAEEQYEIIRKFLEIKKSKKPIVIYRLLGEIKDEKKYYRLPGIVVKRTLHSPMGSFNYRKKNPTIPEIGICLDFLSHPCISKGGKVSICVRFDPKELGVIGDLNEQTLDEIWNSPKRRKWLIFHKQGKRKKIPLCKTCEFWGVPTPP